MEQKKLKELLKRNPQVDAELLAVAIEQAKQIQVLGAKMVNFNIVIPYASDSPSKLFDRAWVEI